MPLLDSQFWSTPATPAVRSAERWPVIGLWCSAATAAIAVLVLLGWLTDVEILKSVLPGLTTMKVNTALSLLLLSAALASLNRDSGSGSIILFVCVGLTVALGIATECENLVHTDLRIDNLLIRDKAAIAFPGRMAPGTIFCFVVYGLGLLCLRIRRGTYAAQVGMAVVILVSTATLGGYLYGAPQMLVHAPYPVVAVHTAVAVSLLALGALMSRPLDGPIRIISAATTGGWVARRLIPMALAVPLGVGLFVVGGQRAGVYGAAFSVALMVCCDIAIMVATVWSVSALLNRSDTARQIIETAAVEGEHRFRELANAMPQMVWTARPDGTIDYLNDRWFEFTGDHRNEIAGQSWHTAVLEADQTIGWSTYDAAMRSGTPFQVECRLTDRRTGGHRWFLTRALPARDPGGAIVRWYGTSTDIDEQKKVIEERRRSLDAERIARAEAERHSQLKDNFLATLSHELRTPLNAILGWSTLLAGRADIDADTQEGIEVIARNARAQTQIVEDLLDMSRIISGKMRLDVQPVDLAGIIRSAVQTVRPSADAKTVQVSVSIADAVPTVMGDANRLQQVAWNLVSNAVKFTPRGGKVRVTLAGFSSHVKFGVEDNGQGINAEFLPHLFERFRQADAGTTRRHGGLGLGLSIVRQLVELHGGSVKAESLGEGQGSSFFVTLPVLSTKPDPGKSKDSTPESATKPAGANVQAVRIAGVRVLVVDDEADARSLVRRMLEDSGARVVTAKSAAEALERLAADDFDVLLSDIGMPELDGYELIRAVRQLAGSAVAEIPAAALTAFARSEDRVRALTAGFQMHVPKPIEPPELLAAVASLSRRARAE